MTRREPVNMPSVDTSNKDDPPPMLTNQSRGHGSSTNERPGRVTGMRELSLGVNEMLVADDIYHIHGCHAGQS